MIQEIKVFLINVYEAYEEVVEKTDLFNKMV